jgi:hypothetical protein
MLTIQLAYEFRDTPMQVNSANPGYTATDTNGNQGNQTLEEGVPDQEQEPCFSFTSTRHPISVQKWLAQGPDG